MSVGHEYNWDEDPFGRVGRPGKRADERAWKQQVAEEIEDGESGMSSVFVILNEWQNELDNADSCVEIESMWSTYEKAHRELSRMAQTYEIYLDLDEDNFVLENTLGGLTFDEYRIAEYGVDDNG